MEKYYRKRVVIDKKSKIYFQCLEWHMSDEEDPSEQMDFFKLRVFGVDTEGRSICCTLTEFKPFFYVKVPMNWGMSHLKNFLSELKIYSKYKTSLVSDKISLVMKKEFYGFCNGEEFNFARLVFHNYKGFKHYMYTIKKIPGFPLYESNIDPILKFYHIQDIKPSGWVHAKRFRFEREDLESSSCQINIQVSWKDLVPFDKEGNADILQASFDIETYSCPKTNEKGEEYYPFPVPEKKENVIYQIATCFKIMNHNTFLVKHLLTLKKCAEINDPQVVVWECTDEKDLLIKWKKLINLMDPDVLYQYNGDTFDCNYMWKRAEMLGIKSMFSNISRLLEHDAELKESTFSSSAYGTSDYKRLVIPGRINFDILIFIKREFKENSYKLDNVSEKYLKEKKNDVKVVDIFKAYESGIPEQIKKIGEYCIQDTLLPQKLVDTLYIFQTQISMSNVTFVPIKYLIERGQQIKALSQIARNTRVKNFLIPHFEYTENEESFKGACVLNAEKGAYLTAISVLDFASLYPSIIMAHNLCYTTFVRDDKYLNLPGVEYRCVDIGDEDESVKCYYAQNKESILPGLLEDLAVQRKKYKKLMEKEEDPVLREIYNKTQLAYKVSMNSIYGILGAGTIGCKPIAATVTCVGREMIEQTKHYIENNHHSVFPEGYTSSELDERDIITVKVDGKEMKIRVKDTFVFKDVDVQIKTTHGWRKFTPPVELS